MPSPLTASLATSPRRSHHPPVRSALLYRGISHTGRAVCRNHFAQFARGNFFYCRGSRLPRKSQRFWPAGVAIVRSRTVRFSTVLRSRKIEYRCTERYQDHDRYYPAKVEYHTVQLFSENRSRGQHYKMTPMPSTTLEFSIGLNYPSSVCDQICTISQMLSN